MSLEEMTYDEYMEYRKQIHARQRAELAAIKAAHKVIEGGKYKSAQGLIKFINDTLGEYHNEPKTALYAFWPTGNDYDMWGALYDAGWKIDTLESDYYFHATAPDGSKIEYCEGDMNIIP